MNEFFLSALSFGLAAGLKPGPLCAIVIQQALSEGLLAGVRASLAPLITDGSIIIAALWFLSQFRSIGLFAAALSLVGGVYLLWLSARMFRVNEVSLRALLIQGMKRWLKASITHLGFCKIIPLFSNAGNLRFTRC